MTRLELAWFVGVSAVVAVSGAVGYAHLHGGGNCKVQTTRAAISTRAAELCTGDLVACQMTFEQVQAVLADQQRAKEACQ